MVATWLFTHRNPRCITSYLVGTSYVCKTVKVESRASDEKIALKQPGSSGATLCRLSHGMWSKYFSLTYFRVFVTLYLG